MLSSVAMIQRLLYMAQMWEGRVELAAVATTITLATK